MTWLAEACARDPLAATAKLGTSTETLIGPLQATRGPPNAPAQHGLATPRAMPSAIQIGFIAAPPDARP